MKSAPSDPNHVTGVTSAPKPRANRATFRPFPPAFVRLSTPRIVSPATRAGTTTVWSIAGLGQTHTNRIAQRRPDRPPDHTARPCSRLLFAPITCRYELDMSKSQS